MEKESKKQKLARLAVSGLFSYGAIIGIGFLTSWKIGVLLFLFAWGHNLEHH